MPCYAYQSPIFYPALRIVESITQANPAVVTTTFDHNYQDGLVVRMNIPTVDGMQQINGKISSITVLTSTTFQLNDIDSTLFETFEVPDPAPPHAQTCAQVVPVGEVNSTLVNSTINTR